MATLDIIFLNEISKLSSNAERWNPYPWYKEMRDHHPVFYDEGQRVWNVFRYDDVKRVLSDFTTFSSERKRSLIPVPVQDNGINLAFSDPPVHRKRRGLLAKAFTPRSLESWKPRIQAVADMLIDKIASEDTSKPIDMMKDFAVPIPVTIIADLLGVPNQDWAKIKEWSDILFMPHHAEGIEETTKLKGQTMQTFAEYLLPLVQHKRKNPQNDILSDLTQAEYDGERLKDEEIVYTGIGLLGAGNETTTTWLTNAFYSFIDEGIYPKLREDPSLIPGAAEEVLRYRFTASMDRTVTEDTDIFGPPMKKGDIIIAWISSANRDEDHFANANQFDITRKNSRDHLTFGNGEHFCLGAPLARLETQIALSSFIRKFRSIRFTPDFRAEEHLLKHGFTLTSLPIMIEQS